MFFKNWIAFYLLDDVVFLEDDKEREEYVMNEQGRIWNGRNQSRPWDFGQVHTEK